ncbi:zinc ribbon domain-containing protein [Candidatus Chlorohelix sp.]|uniref:zinc ribbon domain-containing protein n=1 Tax=Candidatus Chlorohelix sp. TaxID=3139201 RepID=UPI0030539701
MVAVAVVFVVGQPLLQLETGKKRDSVRQLSDAQIELETLRERAGAERLSIEELEFDRELGIIETQDYEILKERSRSRLKTLEGAVSEREEELVEGERELKRKARSAQTTDLSTKRQIAEKTVTDTRSKPPVKESLNCTECNTPFKPGDKFCAKCKAPLPIICLNCGGEIKDEEARFCARCGVTFEKRTKNAEEANS